MKKLILAALAIFSLWIVVAHAQPPGGPPPPLTPDKKEKMDALKAAFLTTKLDLTPEEAKVFWPVYNKYQNELHQLRENRHSEMRKLREDNESMTDKDYEKIYDSEVTFRQAEVDIMKKYQDQLRGTLPIKKLSKLHRAEMEFKRDLLHKMRGRNDGPPPSKRRKP